MCVNISSEISPHSFAIHFPLHNAETAKQKPTDPKRNGRKLPRHSSKVTVANGTAENGSE